MLLKNIVLKNIRSFKELELSFPEGSTLLAGDIGSGKSTILLSVEFALFGLLRGVTSGPSLLRHGSSEGSVELEFELLDKKPIRIKRSLKRGNNGVVQDSGFLEVSGERESLTAVELKSKVLELLGYPESLLSKSKSLLYRYTVYTPQEEMKSILYESGDERLEKLRKVFGFDKYKLVKNNAEDYAKSLRGRIRILKGEADGLDALKEREKSALEIIERKDKDVKIAEEEIKKAGEEAKRESEKLKLMEEENKKLTQLKEKISLLREKESALQEKISSLKKDSLYWKEKASTDLKEPEGKTRSMEEIRKELKLYNEKLEEMQGKLLEAEKKISVLESRKKESGVLLENIESLNVCPKCKQKVDGEHKKLIEAEEKEKIRAYEEKKGKLNEIRLRAQNNIKVLKEKIELLRKEKEKHDLIEAEKKHYEEKKSLREEAKKKMGEIKERIEKDEKEMKESEKEMKSLEEEKEKILVDEKVYAEIKKSIEMIKEKEKSKEIERARMLEEIKGVKERLEETRKEITLKEKARKEKEHLEVTEHWVSSHFTSVVSTIERHVMGAVHAEFTEYFSDWFSKLMEDETISATLDDTFTPIITQNGHDTYIENLSGGEKTSVALSYRLALNKVVNDFVSTIKTKDIIILDEPTDGFSSDQLDKVRDVLIEAGMKQTIIVSHDAKMESFMEHIIRLAKHEHESKII